MITDRVFLRQFLTHLRGSSFVFRRSHSGGGEMKNPPPGRFGGGLETFAGWLAVSPVARSARSGRSASGSRRNRRRRNGPDALRGVRQHIFHDNTSRMGTNSNLLKFQKEVWRKRNSKAARGKPVPDRYYNLRRK